MTDEPCTCRDTLDVTSISESVHTPTKWNASGFRAEMRAIEQGHHAYLLSGYVGEQERSAHAVRTMAHPEKVTRLDFKVVSNCRHGLKHYQKAFLQPGNRLPVKIDCTCEAGHFRAWGPIPCKHAALVGRRLERDGFAEWHDGLWWHPQAWKRVQLFEAETAHVDEHPDDPFEDLAPADEHYRYEPDGPPDTDLDPPPNWEP